MRTTIAILLLALAGCAAHPMPPVPPAQTALTVTSRAQLQPEERAAVLHHRLVSWDYADAMPAANVAFDIEVSTNLTDWQLMETTNQSPLDYYSPNDTEFVRVGAHWINPDFAY